MRVLFRFCCRPCVGAYVVRNGSTALMLIHSVVAVMATVSGLSDCIYHRVYHSLKLNKILARNSPESKYLLEDCPVPADLV